MRPERLRSSFPAMGGTATVLVDGPTGLLELARRRIEDLEAKWSRFRSDSDISCLGRSRDRWVPVSADTRLLLRSARWAWEETGGAFDPSVADALVAWGYDRDLASTGAFGGATGPIRHRFGDRRDRFGTDSAPGAPKSMPAPGLAGVDVDDVAGTATLGGAGFDPGGIAKGLTADLVAGELVDAGAAALLVDLSGDLRMAGEPCAPWVVGIEDPLAPERRLLAMTLTGGGVATSSDRRRRWFTPAGDAHHLIDPATGAPTASEVAGVSVLAGEAWWAEVLTKVVLVGGVPAHAVGRYGASAIARTRAGDVVGTDDLRSLHEEAA